MTKRVLRSAALIASLALALVIAAAANASAATVYVSGSASPVVGGRSCTQPDYSTIGAALGAGASKINVCPGTYTEQLEITSSTTLTGVGGVKLATIAMPAAAVESATACDQEQKDEISICGNIKVSLSNLEVEAIIPEETCVGGFYGIFVGGGATLKATNDAVDGAASSNDSYFGCQHGVALEVGSARNGQVGHAKLKNDVFSGYQKNGPTDEEVGSTLTITNSTVTGAGPSPYTAQNGIQISYGAAGSIKGSTVSGNECEAAVCSPVTGEEASGVLFYQAAAGSSLIKSNIEGNDLGVYFASGLATVSASAEVRLSKDTLANNRWQGVWLEEGKASLASDTIDGSGLVGVEINQYEGQASASESSANGTRIEGQSEAAIKVKSDKQPGDIAGTFTFDGTLRGDGALVIDESNNFDVIH